MTRAPTLRSLAILASVAVLAGCSKKTELPKKMKAVPADATVVATVDAKSLVAFAKKSVPDLLPASLKDQIPPWETLAEQAKAMVGIDIDKLGGLLLIGYAGNDEQVAFVAEGVDPESLKGERKGEHQGVALYSMPGGFWYAPLQGAGVVAAQSQSLVKKVIDSYTGEADNVGSTDKAKMLGKLLGVEEDLSHFRAYVLTSELPNTGPTPFTFHGGGFFIHLDKGAAGTIVTDEDGAGQIKSQLDQGLMMLNMMLAGGGDAGLPVELDAETKKLVGGVLKSLKTDREGELVSVAYHGDLKPLIAKAVALGVGRVQPAPGTGEARQAPAPAPGDSPTPPAKKPGAAVQ